MTTVVALVVRYARRPAALAQSCCSADISTNARRPWRVISIGLQRAYRRNASNSRRNFKIVIMAMTIVRYFDRFACLLRVGDVALCRYSIKSLELSAAKFLSRNTRSAATSHLSQSTTSVRSAKNSRLKSKFVPSFLTARSILPGFAPIASTDRLRAARDAGRGQGGERRAERLRRMAMEKSYIMSMDAGGTMTDTFFVDKSRRFVVGKAQTTPQDESVGFAQSCVDALKQWDTKPEDIFPQVQTGIYSGTSMLNPLLEPKR